MFGNKCNCNIPDDSIFCHYCGNRLKNLAGTSPKIEKRNSMHNKFSIFTNSLCIILTVVAVLCIVCAMNAQDIKRNSYEYWNTTTVYVVLFSILCGFLGFAIYSLIKNRCILVFCLAFIPALAALITMQEGSIASSIYGTYPYYERYVNSDLVDGLNTIWFLCVFSLPVITMISAIVELICKVIRTWHASSSYQEKCYNRVAKIHTYMEKGIITKEEYEKARQEMLKHLP